jgi:transposase
LDSSREPKTFFSSWPSQKADVVGSETQSAQKTRHKNAKQEAECIFPDRREHQIRSVGSKEGEKLTEEERLVRQTVLDASPVVGQGLELFESFREAIGSRSEAELVAWMGAAAESQFPEFENFVKVFRRDGVAARAAASSEWSNGQTN